ncbi:general transcription factor II-I repeat domain-containing protein 2A-like isoform X2 [Helicoverpa zea]|uniref:general transcription factor II-I repeat domain-containing protein 2A-like isoform X2 n=2 Tax=Helicoverpa zea TaxID=7113 RepID=UPI001F574864|nr:general transcription factor II-I repeat domain-containing protein 2A-like isoform X2 [Helicoverpa zea]
MDKWLKRNAEGTSNEERNASEGSSNKILDKCAPKKSKTYHFHQEWELDYFFTMVNGNCCCLICNTSLAIPKKGNLERHFNTMHSKYQTDFPPNSEIRKSKLQSLKLQLKVQENMFSGPIEQSKAATEASFQVSYRIAQKCKPFSDGEYIKEIFEEVSDSLFVNFKNKNEIKKAVHGLQLSRNTVMRRIETISKNLNEQLQKDIDLCVAFSLQFDESTDVTDTAQLLVFIRMVFEDFSTKEELLSMISLKEKTRGFDIFTAFKAYISQIKLPLYKLVSMTTDGAPAMTGIHNGFIALCHKDEDFPDFISYHCIIHQQVLASKRLNTKHVMDISFKIVNSIKGKSLQRRLFKQQLHEKEPELVLHTDVRWLSRSKFLQRFRDLLDEIIKFLDERGDDYRQLRDLDWQCDLAFLADFTGKLSTLNLNLQGKNKTLTEMMSSIAAFQSQAVSMIVDIEKKRFEQFVNIKDHMEKHPTYNFISEKYTTEIRAVVADFEIRFSDFRKIEKLVLFVSYPFNDSIDHNNIYELATKFADTFQMEHKMLQNEIITLRCDIVLKARSTSGLDFWALVSNEKYPNLKKCVEQLHSCFGSTYLCFKKYVTGRSHRVSLVDK